MGGREKKITDLMKDLFIFQVETLRLTKIIYNIIVLDGWCKH